MARRSGHLDSEPHFQRSSLFRRQRFDVLERFGLAGIRLAYPDGIFTGLEDLRTKRIALDAQGIDDLAVRLIDYLHVWSLL